MSRGSIAFFVVASIAMLVLVYNQQFRDKEPVQQIADKTPPTPLAPCTDTIFMGYHFGMTEKEFLARTKELLQSGDLFEKNGKAAGKLSLPDDEIFKEVDVVFSAEYQDGRLSKLKIGASPTGIFTDPQLLTYSLQKMYKNKYGQHDFFEENSIGIQFVWNFECYQINLFNGFTDARIFFEDRFYLDQ